MRLTLDMKLRLSAELDKLNREGQLIGLWLTDMKKKLKDITGIDFPMSAIRTTCKDLNIPVFVFKRLYEEKDIEEFLVTAGALSTWVLHSILRTSDTWLRKIEFRLYEEGRLVPGQRRDRLKAWATLQQKYPHLPAACPDLGNQKVGSLMKELQKHGITCAGTPVQPELPKTEPPAPQQTPVADQSAGYVLDIVHRGPWGSVSVALRYKEAVALRDSLNTELAKLEERQACGQ